MNETCQVTDQALMEYVYGRLDAMAGQYFTYQQTLAESFRRVYIQDPPALY